ncbi:MAG: hypothetical protein U0905_01760 [Pirellulales bacterium]
MNDITGNWWDDLPSLAGMCSMDRAMQAEWSVEESVERLKELHFLLKRSAESLTSHIPGEPIYELKMAYSYHAYLFSEHTTLIRQRVSEMREPPLGLDKVPHAGLELLMNELECLTDSAAFVIAFYGSCLPLYRRDVQRLIQDAHPLADAPTIRILKWILTELEEIDRFGQTAVHAAQSGVDLEWLGAWSGWFERWLEAMERSKKDSETSVVFPEPVASLKPFVIALEPKRDERFVDRFNAGVNPEAFLYDEKYPLQPKTLMMYYKRLRELDVPEMMATILHELRHEEPWEFHREMIRQLWDEARHAMMGEVGFESVGIDWKQIPINFTWSRNLNMQLTARERHGVLFFIEQGLMPKTGKRYEWEIGMQSGDALSGLFQDFDWADEVLHSQIGRRWYVPKFESLQKALDYGDRCWSKVLSHWEAYREQGLTEHRNWWPDLYREACRRWGVEPDPKVLAFNVSYQAIRADLKEIQA